MVSFSVRVLRKIVIPDVYKALSIHKIRQNTKKPTFYKTLYLSKPFHSRFSKLFLPKYTEEKFLNMSEKVLPKLRKLQEVTRIRKL